ncbi:MAG: diacylglycerol/lipid kinase family protein [Candidatus Dormibacteria bacterium]
MTSAAVLINPARVASRSALRAQLHDQLRRAAWPEPTWIETDHQGREQEQLRDALARGVKVVFACGGDGTVARAIQVLAAAEDVALAVVPLGSGNVLARNLGLPREPSAAIQVAIHGATRRIDLGQVDGIRFAVAAGMGLDAQMLADVPQLAKRLLGWAAYVPSGLRHLSDPEFRVEITIDGSVPISRLARSVVIANVGQMPGGIRLLPTAVVDDGLLDVAVIAPRQLRDWLRIGVRLGLRHPDGVGVESFRGAVVEVSTDRARPREMDGEPIASASTMAARTLPGALLVCVPAVTSRA